MCSKKELGGLGIKDLDLFNLSLIGKWLWRILLEEGACWQHIIQSRYGVSVGGEYLGRWMSRNSSQWWRDLRGIEVDPLVSLHWFSEEIRR